MKWKAVLEKYAKAKRTVKAGLLAGATTTDGKSIPQYAAYNEFGTSRIPARPFLRQTADKHKSEWFEILANEINSNPADPNFERGAVLTGEAMKSDIIDTIQNGEFEPNSPITVAIKTAKGKQEPDHPLIDTGQMLQAIAYEVEGGK